MPLFNLGGGGGGGGGGAPSGPAGGDLAGDYPSPSIAAGAVTNSKVAVNADIAISKISGLQTALDGKQASGSYAAASHNHEGEQITSGTISDARLSGNVVLTSDSRLSDARTPVSHTHGNITNGGLIGTTANLPIVTGSGGILQAGSFGTEANTFCQGNDSRLDRSTFIATWTSGGTPGYRNMGLNTLGLINFNTTVLNSDSSNYTLELGNNDNGVDGKIRIAKTGTYLVNLIYNTYDISPGAVYSFYIYTNGTSKSTASAHAVTLFDQEPAGGSAATGARYLFGGMTGVVNVTSAPLWVSLVFRPTAGNPPSGPFPTDGTSGSTTQPPEVQIVRVA